MNEYDEEDLQVKTATTFRYAYILKPGNQDFSQVRAYCERLMYATDGYADSFADQKLQLEESLKDFDPERDILVPIGSAALCLLAATILVRRMLEQGKQSSYTVAVFADRSYRFWQMPIGEQAVPYEYLPA